MNPDELRARLAEIDPSRELVTEPVTTPSSRERLERIMQNDPTTTDAATARRGRWLMAAAAAAAAVVVVGGVVAATGGDDSTEAGPPLELDLGASDAMASCMMVEAQFLADMPVAFAGTATEVEGETVTLTVDEWYVGGDAETVVLHAPTGMEALIDGFSFEEGSPYLVSATDGTVNFCGYSGPATDDLQAVYDEAFPS